MDESQERADFEAWAGRDFYNGLACVRETWNEAARRYFDAAHQMAWQAWRARASLAAQGVPADPCLVLWQAMNEAEKVGNRTDDKLIVEFLRRAGYCIAATSAPPQAQQAAQGVPAGWKLAGYLYDFKDNGVTIPDWFTSRKAEAEAPGHFNVRDCYTPAPPQAQQAEAKPLTDEQIIALLYPIYDGLPSLTPITDTKVARATEAACAEAWGVKLAGIGASSGGDDK